MDYIIKKMTADDWKQVKTIYLQGIKTGDSTFEKVAPDWEKWDKEHISTCRLVAKKDSAVYGWAALSPVSGRCVFAGVAEVSIYIDHKCQGLGVGTGLLMKLIEISEKNGFWTLQSGIFPENEASLSLHKKCGFRKVGVREKLGMMPDGTWRDVVLLERRSKKVGLNNTNFNLC